MGEKRLQKKCLTMFKPVEVDEGHKSTNYRRILHIKTGIEVIGVVKRMQRNA